VVVLGPVGRNFGAGMTGGRAYLLDGEGDVERRVNGELVEVSAPDPSDLGFLSGLVERHAELTGSPRARELLATWATAGLRFVRVSAREDVATITQRNEGTPSHAKERPAMAAVGG